MFANNIPLGRAFFRSSRFGKYALVLVVVIAKDGEEKEATLCVSWTVFNGENAKSAVSSKSHRATVLGKSARAEQQLEEYGTHRNC